MNLKDILQFQNFVVVGNTLDPEKYACKIKDALLSHHYTVAGVHKEYASLDEVPFPIDVIDLCIRPELGLQYLRNCTRDVRMIVIQPGAESVELLRYLKEAKLPHMQACLLIGAKLYGKEH